MANIYCQSLAETTTATCQAAGTAVLSGSGRRAFTLIELLVAVAIIAILAGLLLPGLSRGKAAAKATECRNNLRTLGLAMQMYLGDFNAYPPASGAGILGYGEKYGWLMQDDWKMQLVPFIGVKDDRFVKREDTMRVLRCPQKVANEDGKRGEGQYAMNASGTGPFKTSLGWRPAIVDVLQ